MYLKKSKKGFGWYCLVNKDGQGNKVDSMFLNMSFKKGCDPDNTEEDGSYKGELFFIDKNGHRRKVFPYVNEYQGQRTIELKIMDWRFPSEEEQIVEDSKPVAKNDIELSPDDLPFY